MLTYKETSMLYFVVPFVHLRNGIKQVMPVIPGLRSKELAIYKSITILAKDGVVTIQAYNGIDRIEVCLHNVDIVQEGKVICDPKSLLATIRSMQGKPVKKTRIKIKAMPDDTIEVSPVLELGNPGKVDKQTTIKLHCTIKGMHGYNIDDVTGYLEDDIEGENSELFTNLFMTSFLDGVDSTLFACSTDGDQGDRRNLAGVRIIFNEDQPTRFVATDGCRLVTVVKDGMKFDNTYPLSVHECTLRRDSLQSLQKILTNTKCLPDDEIHFLRSEDHNRIIMRFPRQMMTFSTLVVDQRYPDWEQVIPKPDIKFTVEQSKIEEILSHVPKQTKRNPAIPVWFEVTDSVLTLSWKEEGSKAVTFTTPISRQTGIDFAIQFNAHYLLDAITIRGHEMVTTQEFHFVEKNYESLPMIIRGTDYSNALHLIMPMRSR